MEADNLERLLDPDPTGLGVQAPVPKTLVPPKALKALARPEGGMVRDPERRRDDGGVSGFEERDAGREAKGKSETGVVAPVPGRD